MESDLARQNRLFGRLLTGKSPAAGKQLLSSVIALSAIIYDFMIHLIALLFFCDALLWKTPRFISTYQVLNDLTA